MSKHLSVIFLAVICLAFAPRVQAQFVVSTIAGTPNSAGYSGDEGPATDAQLDNPSDIVLDSIGNIYVADFLNNVLRKIDTNGIIHTIAGTGFGAGGMNTGGYTGDGGPATAAELNGSFAVTFDRSGNLIFADGYNHVVRKVDAAGNISTIAGDRSVGYAGDGGPATAANINNPVGVVYDKHGNLFIADDHNAVIRKVDPSGIITTYAGNHHVGYSGDGGPATAASLGSPIGVAIDTAGNLYIADSGNVVRKVTPTGTISTFAGTGVPGYSGDGAAAAEAQLKSPARIFVDSANNVYISDLLNNVVRKVNTSGIINTIAGDGIGAYFGDDSIATVAEFYSPEGVTISRSGIMYIADRGNDVIRRIGPAPVIDLTGVPAVNSLSSVLTVYPNPSADGRFTYQVSSSATEKVNITIVNILGEVVCRTLAVTNKQTAIKLAQPAGIYFLNAVTAHGKWTKKITIQ